MLRRRLYLGLLPLLLLVVAMGAYAIRVCDRLAGLIQSDLLANYGETLACERMRLDAQNMTMASGIARAGDPFGALQALRRGQDQFRQELMAQATKATGQSRAAGKSRVGYVNTLDQAFQRYANLEKQLVDGGGAGSPAMQMTEGAYTDLSNAIDQLEHYDYQVAQAAEATAELVDARTARILLGAIVVAFLLSVIFAWRLAASLLAPIQALTVSAVAMGEGDLERTVPEFSRDELGLLARAFNTMAAKLRAYRDATAAKVLRAQRTMQATMTAAPDPLFIVDRDGRHEVRNPAAEALAASLSAGFPAPLQQALDEVLATGSHFLPTGYGHLVTLRVGPEDRHYLPRILAIGDALIGFSGAAVLLQDVTRFRLLDDAKNNLVGTVSHELKTPLTSLRLAVYLLLERNLGTLTAPQRELLETARDDADRLLRILNDLLDLARLESGVAQLNQDDVEVAWLLDDMAREMRPIVDGRGQRIEVRVAPELTTVSVDPDRIRHVFINLLTNASKYSPVGSAIELYAEPADAGYVRCGVRDQGPGIPPESLGKIFEKFYRLPGQPNKGAGLGLAIAREIVIAHGGFIACSSRPGEGSDFHFHLPGNSFASLATMEG